MYYWRGEMRKRLGILPGGADEYVDTLRKCLEFVRERNPSKEELSKWFKKTFHSRSERAPRDYVYTIESLQLIVEVNNRVLLSDISKEFLETYENKLVYQQLDTNYLGIHDLLQLLYKEPQKLDEISSFLNDKIGTTWQEGKQWEIRLNWLRSLGYVIKDGSQYRLTMEGRKVFEAETEKDEEMPEHKELRDLLCDVGARLGCFSQTEYPINHYSVDVAWKHNKTDKSPFAVFEIHKGGNLNEALVRLKQARTSLRSEPFLISDKKNMLKAESLLNETFPELVNIIRILHWTEICEFEEYARSSKKFETKTGFKIQVWKRRKKEHVEESVRNYGKKAST